jgi:hypothetical protein
LLLRLGFGDILFQNLLHDHRREDGLVDRGLDWGAFFLSCWQLLVWKHWMESQFNLPIYGNEAHMGYPRKGPGVKSRKAVESPRQESMEVVQEALGAQMLQLARG